MAFGCWVRGNYSFPCTKQVPALSQYVVPVFDKGVSDNFVCLRYRGQGLRIKIDQYSSSL